MCGFCVFRFPICCSCIPWRYTPTIRLWPLSPAPPPLVSPPASGGGFGTFVLLLLGVLLVSGIAYGSWWVLKKTQAEPEAMSGTAMVSGNSAAGAKDDGWELNDAAKAAKELEQAEEQRA